MNIYIIAIVVIAVVFLALKSLLSISMKIIGLSVLILSAALTIWICSAQPDMHKPFSINTIEYLLKINKDGSMTTTKQVTQTVLKQEIDN